MLQSKSRLMYMQTCITCLLYLIAMIQAQTPPCAPPCRPTSCFLGRQNTCTSCLPGYGLNSGVGCYICPYDTYSPGNGNGCLACPSGTYTTGTGSYSISQCLSCVVSECIACASPNGNCTSCLQNYGNLIQITGQQNQCCSSVYLGTSTQTVHACQGSAYTNLGSLDAICSSQQIPLYDTFPGANGDNTLYQLISFTPSSGSPITPQICTFTTGHCVTATQTSSFTYNDENLQFALPIHYVGTATLTIVYSLKLPVIPLSTNAHIPSGPTSFNVQLVGDIPPNAANVNVSVLYCQGVSSLIALDFSDPDNDSPYYYCSQPITVTLVQIPLVTLGTLQITRVGVPQILVVNHTNYNILSTDKMVFILNPSLPYSSIGHTIPLDYTAFDGVLTSTGVLTIFIEPDVPVIATGNSTSFYSCAAKSPVFVFPVSNPNQRCFNTIRINITTLPTTLQGQLWYRLASSNSSVPFTHVTSAPFVTFATSVFEIVLPTVITLSLPYSIVMQYTSTDGFVVSRPNNVTVTVKNAGIFPLVNPINKTYSADQCATSPLAFRLIPSTGDAPYSSCINPPLSFKFITLPSSSLAQLYYSTTASSTGPFVLLTTSTPPIVGTNAYFQFTPPIYNSITETLIWTYQIIAQGASPTTIAALGIAVNATSARPPIAFNQSYTVFPGVNNVLQLTSNPRGCINVPALATWPISVLPLHGTLLQVTTLAPLPLIALPVAPFTILPTDPNYQGLIVYQLSASPIPPETIPPPQPSNLGTDSFQFYTISSGRLSINVAMASLTILNPLLAQGQTINIDENVVTDLVLYGLISTSTIPTTGTEIVIESIPNMGTLLYGTGSTIKIPITNADLPFVIPFNYPLFGHTTFGDLLFQPSTNVSGTTSFQFYFAIPGCCASALTTETIIINEINLAPWWQVDVLSPSINTTLSPIQDGIFLNIGQPLVLHAVIHDSEPSIYPMTMALSVTSPLTVTYLTLSNEFNIHELLVSGGNNTAAITVIAQKSLLNDLVNTLVVHFYAPGTLTLYVYDNNPYAPLSATFIIPLLLNI